MNSIRNLANDAWLRRARVVAVAVLMLGALGCTGCSTPASRIRKNQALFDSFPVNVQTNLRAGRIDIGYTQPMTLIALGRPDRVYHRKTGDTNTVVWSYSAYRRRHQYEPMLTPDSYIDSRGRVRYFHHSTWVDVGWDEEYDVLRLEFNEQGVSAIESLQP